MQKVGKSVLSRFVGVAIVLILILTSICLPAVAAEDSFTVSFVGLSKTVTETYKAGESITYPTLSMSTNVQRYDLVWSALEDAYAPVPQNMPAEDLSVYEYENPVIGCETPSKNMINNAKSITQSAEQVYTGNFAYKFENNEKVTAYSGWGHRTGNSIYLPTLSDNTGYLVTFKYFIPEGNEDTVTVLPYTGHKNPNPNVIGASYTATVLDDSVKGEWVDGEVVFNTAALGDTNTMLYLYFYATGMDNTKKAVAYIDDVEVKERCVITLKPGYGASDITVNGGKGENIVLPTVTNKDGRPFIGWYTDETFTAPFTATHFSENALTLYAKWGEEPKGPIEFDFYKYSADNGYAFGKRTLSIVNEEGIGVEDDYALKFTFDGDAAYTTDADGKVTAYMSTRASQPDHTAAIANIKAGSIYKVSFMYKTLEECETGYSFILRTAAKGNVWAHVQTYSDTRQYIGAEASDWKEMTYYFIAEPAAAQGSTLFLQMNSTDRTEGAYVEALVDRISVEELSGGVLYFHGNAEGLETVIINAPTGEELPDPGFKYGSNKLLGWYLDSACNAPFEETTVPAGITHIYAKWSEEPVTFENYVWTKENGVAFGSNTLTVEEGPGVGYDDDYVLHFEFDADRIIESGGKEVYLASRFAQRDHLARVGKVENGELYRITYYYKQMASNCYMTVRPVSAVGGNAWVSYTSYASQAQLVLPTDETITDGEWKKVTQYFVADVLGTGGSTGNTLFLQFNWSDIDLENYGEMYVDTVTLEKIQRPYIFFEQNNGTEKLLVQGTADTEIQFPTVERFGYTFTGWYSDEECKTPYKGKTYTSDMGITLYAGWKPLSQVKYNFENYNLTNVLGDSEIVSVKNALSGSKVVKFDRTGTYNGGGSYIGIAHDKEMFRFEKGKNYIVSFNYYIAKAPDDNFSLFLHTGKSGNYWAYGAKVSETAYIQSNTEVGRWNSMSISVDLTEMKETAEYLYLGMHYGKNGIVYFDDFTVTTIPAGQGAVAINNGGCTSLPIVLTGKIGASYASKLPANAKIDGKYFKGYYTKDANGTFVELTADKMVFAKEVTNVYARFIDYKMEQNFDTSYQSFAEKYTNYTIYDFDYELYDSEKAGNSKENVTSGRYSLHRKGNTPYFENALLLTFDKQIAEGETYEITFKVKLGKHYHTDGAVKVASGRSFVYSWTTTGDYYPVVPIADLADGQWHEVSYVFNSVEPYVVVQTPGYCELFIDDVELELKGDAFTSNPKAYTEYVPAYRDENGNIIDEKKAVDISAIVDTSLGKTSIAPIIAVIGGGAVVIVAVIVLILLLVKKKKKKTN